MQVRRQGNDLYKKGRYQEAIPFLQKALKIGEREFGPDHETTATLINNLAFRRLRLHLFGAPLVPKFFLLLLGYPALRCWWF